MAIKHTVLCDISNKELNKTEINQVTICNIIYKKSGKVKDFRTGASIDCVDDIEQYEFHITPEYSSKFMQGIKDLILKLKGEHNANNR